jgi:hypothetical protein
LRFASFELPFSHRLCSVVVEFRLQTDYLGLSKDLFVELAAS